MGHTLSKGTILQGSAYRYEIVRTLGQGTFGITYLANAQIPGPLGTVEVQVALKEFFMRDINSREDGSTVTGSRGGFFEDYRRKFRREALNLSHIQHPNIVKVLEMFDANGTSYIAMNYLDGGSLDNYIQHHGHLTSDEALAIICPVADALRHMHEAGMLHLDLKPGNIMLTSDGKPVIIDFGLSKQYDESGNPESSTAVGAGTPGYAPIEQSSYREGSDFPVSMDIYALGATLFKMLTGHRPPDASVIFNDGFPEANLDKPWITPQMKSCVIKAMQPRRMDRYQTVTEFLDVLVGQQVPFNGQLWSGDQKRDNGLIYSRPITDYHTVPMGEQNQSQTIDDDATELEAKAFPQEKQLTKKLRQTTPASNLDKTPPFHKKKNKWITIVWIVVAAAVIYFSIGLFVVLFL